MTPLQALILGIVQGVTEFLPISSSGHLLLAPHVFGWPEQPLAFDVALHIGTLLAIVIYFHREWMTLLAASVRDLRCHGLRVGRWGPSARLTLLIGLGTVPAVVVGLLVSAVEDRLRAPAVVVVTLVLGSAYMAAAEWWSARQGVGVWVETAMTPGRALLIGVAQAAALVPGVSRSGSTIATGMFAGLGRAAAARFSFLLATPVTLAAAVKELPSLRDAGAQGISGLEIGIGIAASFVVGVAAIAFLLRYLAARPLYVFVWYRLALAVVVLLIVVG
jgi:undecaprenyl-diphosphatase